MNDKTTPVGSDATTDVNIAGFAPLVSPRALKDELPISDSARKTVLAARETISSIIDHSDDRLLVVVGRIHREPPELHIEAVTDGVRFTVDEDLVIEGYHSRRFDVPEEWLERIKVETYGK